MTVKRSLADIEPREVVPGYRARFIHTDHTTHMCPADAARNPRAAHACTHSVDSHVGSGAKAS